MISILVNLWLLPLMVSTQNPTSIMPFPSSGRVESAPYQPHQSSFSNSRQLTQAMVNHLKKNAIQKGIPSEKLEPALNVFYSSAPAVIDKGSQRLLTELASNTRGSNFQRAIIEKHATKIRDELSQMMMSHEEKANVMSQYNINSKFNPPLPSNSISKRAIVGTRMGSKLRKSATWQRNKPELLYLGEMFAFIGVFLFAIGLPFLIIYLIGLVSRSGR